MDNKLLIEKTMQEIEHYKSLVKHLQKQAYLLNFASMHYHGFIQDYQYKVRNYCYHQKNYFDFLIKILENHIRTCEIFDSNVNDIRGMSIPNNLLDPLAFELESLIICFRNILDGSVYYSLIQTFGESYKIEFEKFYPKKHGIDSLQLRVKILRDCIIHSPGIKEIKIANTISYNTHLLASADMLNVIHFSEGRIQLWNTIFDIKYNQDIRLQILNNMKDGMFRKKLFDVINNNNELARFDSFNYLFDLFQNIFTYLNGLNNLVVKLIIQCSRKDDFTQSKYEYEDEIISYYDVFEKCEDGGR